MHRLRKHQFVRTSYKFYKKYKKGINMKVKLNQAVKMLFGKSSLEMIYFEAIANSLDANATEINIKIEIENFKKSNSLKINISDNGEGFTDERYKKFSNLFDVEEDSHKGIGRLVYLCYFNNVKVTSCYEENKKREFNFSEKFGEKSDTITDIENVQSSTIFEMKDYSLTKLAKHEFIQSEYLKYRILEKFISRLFLYKKDNKQVVINIESVIDNHSFKEKITNYDIPDFTMIELKQSITNSIDLINKFSLYYSIEKVDPLKRGLTTAISVDNRTHKLDIIAEENIPIDYKMTFLLYSDYFIGKVEQDRQNHSLSTQETNTIKNVFQNEISKLIEKAIPKIVTRNQNTQNELINTYPHLDGYFVPDNIGYISRENVLKDAQKEFLKDQKELLEAGTLNDKQYDKAMEMSSRSLAEYVLYREKIINKLGDITDKNSEADIHNIIIPQNSVLKDNSDLLTIYKNNLWLLDDKYMTYSTAMSEKSMKNILEEITQEKVLDKDNSTPDIAVIFSNDPKEEENKTVDVVIVELKKRGIQLAKTEEVISQLNQRARKLMHLYPNKIQRIWFYGIVEFNDEFKLSLKDGGYTPLYSKDCLYYKENKIHLNVNDTQPYMIGTYILSIDAFIEDAKARNSTFLQILKNSFKNEHE